MSLIIPWLSYAVFVGLAAVFAFFLLWRACRHELIDSEDAFDLAVVGAISALVFARLVEFLTNFDKFEWSFFRLLFFNVFPGFDFYGGLLGLFLAVVLSARAKKLKPIFVLDLLAAPLVFSQAILALGKYLTADTPFRLVWVFYAAGFLVIFWILKRFARYKRHEGFFINFYLVSYSVLEILIFWWRDDVLFIFKIPYQLIVPLAVGQATLIFWYVTAKRNFGRDLKNTFAMVLLSVLRFKRMLLDINEAGKFSRSVILSPYWVARELAKLLKLVGVEIVSGLFDLMHVFGVKK